MRDAQDADVLAGSHTARHLEPLRRAVAVAGGVVAIDQLTKWWAVESLSTGSCSNPDACVELLAGLRLRLVFNTGAAFTTGSGYGPFLAVLAIVMTIVLLTMASRRSDRRGTVLLAAIAGGAVGNLLDRVFRADDGLFSGPVIDFIDVGWWPVFNVADSAIVVGVVAIIMLTFFEDRPTADEDIPTEDPAAEHTAEQAEPDPVSGDAVG